MMTKLNNYCFLKNIYTYFLSAIIFIFLCCYQKYAFSQNNNLRKESLSNIVSSDIKVSELSKPSLGSLGVNTKANNLLGLNIWKNMNVEDVIEHLNYIPDTSASKHLHRPGTPFRTGQVHSQRTRIRERLCILHFLFEARSRGIRAGHYYD